MTDFTPIQRFEFQRLAARVESLSALTEHLAADAEQTVRHLDAVAYRADQTDRRVEALESPVLRDGPIRKRLRELTERVEALEARPYTVPGEVVLDGEHTLDDHCPVCFGCCGGDGVPDDDPDPAPVPEWRQVVDESPAESPAEDRVALSWALNLLAEIAAGEDWYKSVDSLGQVVAHCEARAGDGWRADPDLIRTAHDDGRQMCDVECLVQALVLPGRERWTVLGGRAAAWLKAIIEERAT